MPNIRTVVLAIFAAALLAFAGSSGRVASVSAKESKAQQAASKKCTSDFNKCTAGCGKITKIDINKGRIKNCNEGCERKMGACQEQIDNIDRRSQVPKGQTGKKPTGAEQTNTQPKDKTNQPKRGVLESTKKSRNNNQGHR
jgi:hypothetical protein